MGAAAGVDHRVRPLQLEIRVVPAAPQLVARVVVRRRRDPHRPGPVGRVLEVDEHLLPVRLVVVDPGEGRAVVVHEVEEQVLEADPAVPPHHAAVVDVAVVLRECLRVLDLRATGRSAGNRPAHQQRSGEAGVDQPREQTHAGETGRRLEFAVGPVAAAIAQARSR